MRGSFATQVPVIGTPLPSHVRAEIRQRIRDGHSNVRAVWGSVSKAWLVESIEQVPTHSFVYEVAA